MASYVRILVANAQNGPVGFGRLLVMYRLRRLEILATEQTLMLGVCERSDGEGKVRGIAGNNSRAWVSILPVSVSRLGFRARPFGLLHSGYICLGSTNLSVPPQQRDAFQGAFLKQRPLQTLLARYYPQLICIDLFSHQYRSPSGSCTTGGDTSPPAMMKSRPSQELARPSSTIFASMVTEYPTTLAKDIDPIDLLCFRYAVDRSYYMGISRRTCALQYNRLCASRWLLLLMLV
jgi:hypothetical protein